MKAETTPPTPELELTDEYVADLAAAKRLIDEVFREVFGQRRDETLQ